MLAEERFSKILSIIESEGSATMQKLMIALDASESTIRRDLNTMDENGLLTKVHGGAIAKKPSIKIGQNHSQNIISVYVQNIKRQPEQTVPVVFL